MMNPIQYCWFGRRLDGLRKLEILLEVLDTPVWMMPVLSNSPGEPWLSSYTTAAHFVVVSPSTLTNWTSCSTVLPGVVMGVRKTLLARMKPCDPFEARLPSVKLFPPPATETVGAQPGGGTPRSHGVFPATILSYVLYSGSVLGLAK